MKRILATTALDLYLSNTSVVKSPAVKSYSGMSVYRSEGEVKITFYSSSPVTFGV
jgi:hypothetical protein